VIFDAIAKLLVAVVKGVMGLFPAYEMPSGLASLGDSIGGSLAGVSAVFPVGTVGVCLALLIGARIILSVFNLVVFVYQLIPLKFT
jgi:hypothetical protein